MLSHHVKIKDIQEIVFNSNQYILLIEGPRVNEVTCEIVEF